MFSLLSCRLLLYNGNYKTNDRGNYYGDRKKFLNSIYR